MKTIVGYAATFASPSYDLGGFTETIDQKAFDKVLRSGNDCTCLFNHDPSVLLGRTESRTLKLNADSVGLRYECSVPNTQAGNDVYELISRGDIRCSSFGFVCEEDDWELTAAGAMKRRVLSVADLIDVSPVVNPAYPKTSVKVERSAVSAEYGETAHLSNEEFKTWALGVLATERKRDAVKTQSENEKRKALLMIQMVKSGMSVDEARKASGWTTTQTGAERRSLDTSSMSDADYEKWALGQLARFKADAGEARGAGVVRRTYRVDGKVVTREAFVAAAEEHGHAAVEYRLTHGSSNKVERTVKGGR